VCALSVTGSDSGASVSRLPVLTLTALRRGPLAMPEQVRLGRPVKPPPRRYHALLLKGAGQRWVSGAWASGTGHVGTGLGCAQESRSFA